MIKSPIRPVTLTLFSARSPRARPRCRPSPPQEAAIPAMIGTIMRALEQLKALGHDDYANVADLIGYAYRKLGDYKLSQVCYERALKSDPNHVLTWDYYWQIEQGNREQAEYHLSRIAEICGTDCSEYRTLAAALDQPPGTGLVY